jgi:radical SAM protein with 4Fe4S-binding SPASM domain
VNLFDGLRLHHKTQPYEVSIETQALCNARCTFCPYPTLERKGTKMSDELLDRLMAEFTTWTQPFYFSPFKVNEPFLDKRLIPLCEKFNETVPQGGLRLFTNGSALVDKHIEGVAKLQRVAHLWISLNEHEPDAYEATMGLNFDNTTHRLDRLHEYVEGGAFPHKVVVSRVGMNQDFILYVIDRWPRFQPAIIKRDAWIDFTNADNLEVPDGPCGRWWELNIMADGKVALCCMDGTGEYSIGDVNTQTMLEVYNSPSYRAMRDLASRKGAGDPCSRCSY